MKCPRCNKIVDYIDICDNDCNTYICYKCGEFYEQNKKFIVGHNPNCGNE